MGFKNTLDITGSLSFNRLSVRGSIELTSTLVHIDTTAAWESRSELVGKKGHFYVYSDLTRVISKDGEIVYYPGIKMGDGVNYLKDAVFLSKAITDPYFTSHYTNSNIHVTADDKTNWDDKVSITLDGENLIFSK